MVLKKLSVWRSIYLTIEKCVYGAVAQLGARLNGIQKVAGSIPASSIEEPVS